MLHTSSHATYMLILNLNRFNRPKEGGHNWVYERNDRIAINVHS
jgi:hypothetical protein